MHVCHLITRLIVGGAQENTLLTCEGLQRRGHRVTLISGPTRGPEGSLVGRALQGGYRFLELRELIRPINPWMDARALRLLAMELARLRPDVVHTHSSKAGIVGRLAAHRARVPRIVHTVHGMSFNRTQPWALRKLFARLERRAARRTHALVAVAEALAEQCRAARICPRQKVHTIYSGMEVERFTPGRYDRAQLRLEWGIPQPDEAIVVGTIARLSRHKGYEQLLPVMAGAARREPRLRFVWAGDGAQRGEYEAALRRRGLARRTRLLGLVHPAQIPRLLAGFDVLAHTSQWEGLPRSVVQAALMQVPAVAFNIDGTPEVIADGRTGRLVALNDTAGFVEALLELARDPPKRRRMGRAARAACRERFDSRRMVEQLERLYQRLLP